jgi:hypothetical protein
MTTQDIAALEKELRLSITARAILFSCGVILTEGETELGALPIWFSQVYDMTLEALDLTILSVGGDRGFERMVRYANQFKIPWAIVCDGAIIGDAGTTCPLAEQLRDAGIEDIPDLTDCDFAERRRALELCGVFTTAESVDRSFETLSVIREHRAEAKRQVGRSKPRQGRAIAENNGCPAEVRALLTKIRAHVESSTVPPQAR